VAAIDQHQGVWVKDDKTTGGVDSPSGAQTLMRALDILDETLDGPTKIQDLAAKLGLSKTTAHRLVKALRSRDYLALTPDGLALGPKLLQLGQKAREHMDPARVARPHMERLSELTGHCTFIGKREGDWSRHLDRVTGRQRLLVATAPGDRRPIAETGMGKALLLDEGEDELRRLYDLAKGGHAAPARMKSWLAEMKTHHDNGVVRHDSEIGDGVRSIAAPIRGADGRICLAINIASAAHYLDDAAMERMAPQVRQTAVDISAALGYSPRS
jgi:DNA-binding IclR family transcriptional regulator